MTRDVTTSGGDKIRKSLINMVGKDARAWKGENAGYVAKHSRIAKHYGKAHKCEMCNTITAKRFEWSNVSGKYKREIEDYIMLCPSCHRKKDHGECCRKGHKYTKESTYITKEGWRCCKICQRENQRLYILRKKNAEVDKV